MSAAPQRPQKATADRARGVSTNRFLESVLAAFSTIKSNRIRSFLTSLGILIGVMNVVAMVSIVTGINESVLNIFRSMGTNSFIVTKFPTRNVSYAEYLDFMRRPDLTADDAEAIAEICPSVAAASPQSFTFRKIRFRSETTREMPIVGVTPDYQYIADAAVEDGRFFVWPESDRRRSVAVLGPPVSEYLFGEGGGVGREVLIGGRKFRVVGVMEEMGEIFGQSLDDYVIIPYGTLEKLYGSKRMARLSIKAVSAEVLDQAIREVEVVLRGRRGLKAAESNDFEVTTQAQLVEMYGNLTRVTFFVMIGISAIALVVGGVGIMNIMLVSVTERTREIGIRKAVGARSRDIAFQFLVESAVLAALGGLMGLVVAIVLAKSVASLTPIPASVAPWSAALALGVSISVGVFFGLYPSTKAARLDPIVALRYE